MGFSLTCVGKLGFDDLEIGSIFEASGHLDQELFRPSKNVFLGQFCCGGHVFQARGPPKPNAFVAWPNTFEANFVVQATFFFARNPCPGPPYQEHPAHRTPVPDPLRTLPLDTTLLDLLPPDHPKFRAFFPSPTFFPPFFDVVRVFR